MIVIATNDKNINMDFYLYPTIEQHFISFFE